MDRPYVKDTFPPYLIVLFTVSNQNKCLDVNNSQRASERSVGISNETEEFMEAKVLEADEHCGKKTRIETFSSLQLA